jgi:hypothetical protein
MISVNVTGVDQVRAMLSQIGKQLANKALSQTAVQVENYIEQEAAKHNKTGALVRSIYKTRLADGSWEIGHDPRHAPHALFVHWGTKKHDIRPKNKKVLRWASGGVFHFAKVVHHPGNKPDKWLERAAASAPQMFAARVAQQVAQFNQG